MEFIKELTKLGLKDKESAVYVACLELGPSPVQNVARKAKVVRATTYVILESLLEKGLVTKYKEGKKTLFSAESPQQLMRLLEKQDERLRERKNFLNNLLPELLVMVKSSQGRPTVRYFSGVEGLRAIRRDMMMYTGPGDMWYNFTPIDYLDAVLGKDTESYYKQRVAKKIRSRTIFSTKSPEARRERLSVYDDKYIEQRYVSADLFPSTSGMTVYRDRIAIGSFVGTIGGVIVEDAQMADMMRRLFELAWKYLEKS